MSKNLHLNIVSPEKIIFDGNVQIVTLPGSMGAFSILPGHAPIISSLSKGIVSFRTEDSEEHSVEVQGGFIEMNNNVVSVCIS